MVNLHRGFGGQNLGVKFGKFRNADLHQGLSGFCGDLLNLEFPNVGRANTVFNTERSNITPKIKTFFVSIVFELDVLKNDQKKKENSKFYNISAIISSQVL